MNSVAIQRENLLYFFTVDQGVELVNSQEGSLTQRNIGLSSLIKEDVGKANRTLV